MTRDKKKYAKHYNNILIDKKLYSKPLTPSYTSTLQPLQIKNGLWRVL